MGAGNSKPEASGGSKHVFSSSSPVQFSSNLVESLQTNAETDSSRAKTLELQIQARVAEELNRIRSREQQTLHDIEARLLAETKDENKNTPASISPTPAIPAPATASYPPSTSPNVPGALNLDAPRIPFAGRELGVSPVDGAGDGQGQVVGGGGRRELSHDSVAREIDGLRSKLDGRRKLMTMDEGVEGARGRVVGCLRLNDRRPLDCWREVEEFKREVARLEEAFVDRVVG